MSVVCTRIIGLLIAIVVANACAFSQDVGPPAAPAPRILIELPDNIPSDSVWIRYLLSDPGSSAEIVKREPNLRRYVIDARIGLKPARHAKIVIYAVGCQENSNLTGCVSSFFNGDKVQPSPLLARA
jgi:hypothetical protein